MVPSLLISLLLWIWDNRSFDTISRSNRAKMEAQEAYTNQDYKKATEAYRDVTSASLFAEPEARLNLAHSYFQLKQLKSARRYYSKLARLKDPFLASKALNQLGIIAVLEKDTLAGLNYLKESLKENPDNQKSRFNYEFLKKKYSGIVPEPKSSPNTTRNETTKETKPTKTESPQVAQEAIKTEQKKDILNRLQNIKMTEVQAMMILDALKASEIQYLQQQKHRSNIPNDDSKGKW